TRVTWICQTLFGVTCVVLSIMTLRVACRRLIESASTSQRAAKAIGVISRGPVGDYPMWWKERGRSNRRLQAIVVVCALAASGLTIRLMYAWTWNSDDVLGGIVAMTTIVLCAGILLANARSAMSI